MEDRCGFNTSDNAHGLEEMFTDFDQWICRFNAIILTSRLSTDDSTCITKPVSTMKQHKSSTRTQEITVQDSTENMLPRSEVTASLQEIFVNGLLVAQKIRNYPFNEMMDFFNMFKTNDDFTNYDYVLLTLVKENGRKNFYKYIRSKI